MTLEQALNGQQTRVIGKVEHNDITYTLSLRRCSGWGLITPCLKLKGRSAHNFGRFGYDSTLKHMLNWLKEYRLANGATVTITI